LLSETGGGIFEGKVFNNLNHLGDTCGMDLTSVGATPNNRYIEQVEGPSHLEINEILRVLNHIDTEYISRIERIIGRIEFGVAPNLA
jgi:hypothetical protein